ncbi:DUF4198 domain-containing protein [Microvirga sp. STR05]|uniref:DUF4198 domain-containing protein n=1 Tax=Hymenobacter duratus TaxID=2771356 RepID=A0ABR8JKY1_9BACT|nr:DUF4198 domain-containing protein [Hymenobacter duratus]MBD2716525.1 DUF4198 domain-containing protein [Hymenobacter duratus]MBR7951440.1 DUF4198 domain-containing protein [Microvirga sp. STR05]
MAACLLAGASLAGEFWLQPSQFFAAPGTTLTLRVLVGTAFAGTQWAGKSSRVTQLVHFAPAGYTNLLPGATAPDTLHPVVHLQQPGTHLVALTTNNAFLTLDADRFNSYLKAAGLDYILLERQRRGSLQLPGREAYRRCAKTLLAVGSPSASDTARTWSRPTGMPLELVPEQNPYTLKAGASFTVRVLAEGQPRPGQLVQVWQRSPGQAGRVFKLYSNQNGRVLFRLTEPGEYLLSTVHMVPARLPEADWQTTWSSLTFGFRPVSGR